MRRHVRNIGVLAFVAVSAACSGDTNDAVHPPAPDGAVARHSGGAANVDSGGGGESSGGVRSNGGVGGNGTRGPMGSGGGASVDASAGGSPSVGGGGSTNAGGSDAGANAGGGPGNGGSAATGGASSGGLGGTGGVAGGGGAAGAGAVQGSGGAPGGSCTSDATCASGSRCDTLAKKCVSCLYDTDCAWGNICEDGICTPAKYCSYNGDCALTGRPVCDTTRDRCVQCGADTDCAADKRCFAHLCKPIDQCTTTLDCPAGKVCNTTRRMCASCLVDTDCAGGKVCHSSECTAPCKVDADCGSSGLRCDAKACVQCLADQDCPGAFYCKSGDCILDSCESGRHLCAGGLVDVEIAPGLFLKQFQFGRAACNGRGDALSSVVQCNSNETCVTTATDGVCVARACPPGSVVCAQDKTGYTTCSDDGTAVVSTTLCTGGKQCAAGGCYTFICQPSTQRCSTDHLGYFNCNSTGTAETSQTCSAGHYCKEFPPAISCVSQQCTPNQIGCVAGVVAQCDSYGSGNTTIDDCVTNKKLCSAAACVDTVTDVGPDLAPTGLWTGAVAEGPIIHVTEARSLRKLEFRMAFSDARVLSWLVYESPSATGTFTKISETTTNVTGSGDQFYASGALNVPLAAGKYYVLAVHWDDTATDMGFPGTLTTQFGTIPFGTVTGGIAVLGAVPATVSVTTAIYAMSWRITTGVP